MTRWPLLAIALLVCALTLAACGGDDDPKDSADAAKVLEATFAQDKEIKSGRLDVNLKLDADTPSAMQVSGPFQTQEDDAVPRFDFQIVADGGAGADDLKIGAISTGDEGFLRFGGDTYAMPDELFEQLRKGYEDQAKSNAEESKGMSFQALGIDPRRWLKDAEVAGEETAGGVPATHVTAGVDVPRFLDDLDKVLQRPELAQATGAQAQSLSAEQRKVIAESVQDASVDVWTGAKDRILRRLNVVMRFDVPDDKREQAGGLTDGTLRLDLALGGVNEPQRIEAPKDAKPLEDLLARAAAAAQQAQGQAGARQPQGQAGAPQPPEASSKYRDCVQQAGGDIKKLQGCADLVGA